MLKPNFYLFILAGISITFFLTGEASSKTFLINEEPASPYDCGYQDGPSPSAKFCNPFDLATDGTNLFVTDTFNHVIRKIGIVSGTVTTLAGTAGSFGSVDKRGSEARFLTPHGLTIDHKGINLYLADTGNHTIRKIRLDTGEVSTVAGKSGYFGSEDGEGLSARFNEPVGITIDPTDTWLYITDSANHAIRKIVISTGTVSTLSGRSGYVGFSDGAGDKARFDHPSGITIDHKGNSLYITDSSNQAIRKIMTATGEATTLANPSGASLFFPQGLTLDQADESLYIADTGHSALQRIVIMKRELTTYPLSSKQSPLSPLPQGICFDPSGKTLFFTDKKTNSIVRLDPAARKVNTLAGPSFSFLPLP